MNNHVTTIHGARIEHDLLGLKATATYGDKTESFAAVKNPKTGFSVEPSALQQAIDWAKELNKQALAEFAANKRKKIADSVAEAKQPNKPKAEGAKA